jgi:hypothetical protein
MSCCNIECSTIEKQPQDTTSSSTSSSTSPATSTTPSLTTSSTTTILSIKEQLKTLSVEERYNLLNTINMEERVSFIKQQQQLAKDEEDKITQCPLFKKMVSMNNELQDLRMELQKLKNKSNETKVTENTMRCPYSMFRINQVNQTNQSYLNEEELCNELTESCTSSFSWWSTIMFIVFMLFVLTAKPSKHCEQFMSTVM